MDEAGLLNRREVLVTLAAVPVVLGADESDQSIPFHSHELFFREHADSSALFDGGPETPGTVYESFYEVWVVGENGQHVERVAQEFAGFRYRILEQGSDELATFVFYDHEGLGRPTIRLHQLERTI